MTPETIAEIQDAINAVETWTPECRNYRALAWHGAANGFEIRVTARPLSSGWEFFGWAGRASNPHGNGFRLTPELAERAARRAKGKKRVLPDERARRSLPTIPCTPLPRYDHPIWSMGHDHVEVAHAVCSAFLALRSGNL